MVQKKKDAILLPTSPDHHSRYSGSSLSLPALLPFSSHMTDQTEIVIFLYLISWVLTETLPDFSAAGPN